MAARVCLAARKGEWQAALELFDRAVALMNHSGKTPPVRWTSGSSFDPGIVSPVDEILMLAEAALEVHRWDDVQRLSEKPCRSIHRNRVRILSMPAKLS
jgi:hypothetical protein